MSVAFLQKQGLRAPAIRLRAATAWQVDRRYKDPKQHKEKILPAAKAGKIFL